VDKQGTITVLWYDGRRDPTGRKLDVFGTTSGDGGLTFSSNFRVTDQSLALSAGQYTDPNGHADSFLGDFLGLAIANGTAYAAWTDTRGGNQDVFFSRFASRPRVGALNDRFEPRDTPTTATNLGTVSAQQFL